MGIKPVDTPRKTSGLKPADLEGLEGRWLDVPRLGQRNSEWRSNLWCGRASAAMIYNYYCKVSEKTDQYIGHEEGPAGPGLNGQRYNIRFLGGPDKGKLAGVAANGTCDTDAILRAIGGSTDFGELGDPAKKLDLDGPSVERLFAPHIAQLRKNNPVMQLTQLSHPGGGHIVVVCGYKKDTARGELWLRVIDPCWPHEELLGSGNYVLITKPVPPDREFSEYWVKARRLLETYPGRTDRLYSHADSKHGGFRYAIPPRPVPDDSELVHKITRGAGDTATGDNDGAKAGKKDDAQAKAPPAACPPASGSTRLPFLVNDTSVVTSEAIVSLYHQTERGLGGFFPLGDNGLFHCGAHLAPNLGTQVFSIADGEVVAARIGGAQGEHPWGETGFVIVRHPLKSGKSVYSLFVHLRHEALHPDRTTATWLRRLLIHSMEGKEQKSKWRVSDKVPTWKDEDKATGFSPANVHNDVLLEPGVYEEEEEFLRDMRHYVKVKGKWVKVEEGKVKELSPWTSFDLERACKNSPAVKSLRDGKVAVLDADKKDGKRIHRIEAGEVLGQSGSYLGSSALHWSVFGKDDVFPAGSLPDKEFDKGDAVKVSALDLSSKDHGTPAHALALIEALDPTKKKLGKVETPSVLEPGELRHFYRTPNDCWRGRYQAVKGVADFKLDLDKLVRQDRYKSHSESERTDFIKSGKAFLFWDELASAEEFPVDGKATFVHPVTALRLMSEVAVAQDHDDPQDAPDEPDRLHAGEDVVLVVRDAKGPLAGVAVTVKADGQAVAQAKTDSQGELVVKKEDVVGKDIEVSIDAAAVGDKGQLVQVANETSAPATLTPGDAPGNQTFNGSEVVPNPRLGLRMKLKKGALVKRYARWNGEKFQPEAPGKQIPPESIVTAERIVFRRQDGKFECIQLFLEGKECYAWSIENGVEKVEAAPEAQHDGGKEPAVVASWSQRTAHLVDHPVLAGRVQNIADGTELEIHFHAMMSVGAPDHDREISVEKVRVAAGGFSLGFEPHALTGDANLLNAPRPVFARVKAKDKSFSLRDQAVTIYGDAKVADSPPKAEVNPGAGPKAKGDLVAYVSIDRNGTIDKPTLGDKDHSAPAERKISQLTFALARRLVADGADSIYVGTCAPMQHLATEDEKGMTAEAAVAHHSAALKKVFPEAPDWVLASDAEHAWKLDNGVKTGVCAKDCKSGVAAAGRKSGCTESIRNKNLSSCHASSNAACATVVQLGHPNIARAQNAKKGFGCPEDPGACGTAEHDKSKCFLADAALGELAEDRERWFVRLPMTTKGAGYPYLHRPASALNLKVLLINPQSGAAVVCSQEERGSPGLSAKSQEASDAAVKADEFAGAERMVGCSYEVAWKLGLGRAGADSVVLMAFVPMQAALGPVSDGAVIKLKKVVPYEEIMGESAPAAPGVPGENVKSSNISVSGQHFVTWFNTIFQPANAGFHESMLYAKRPAPKFNNRITNRKRFCDLFDNVKYLWAPEITLEEFIGFFCIFYNETGGSFEPVAEGGNEHYMFGTNNKKKRSYNGGDNRKAGDLLVERQVLAPDEKTRIAAWNATDDYPGDLPLDIVHELDFWKFRGHGFIQTTWRKTFHATVDPHLKAAGYSSSDELKSAELSHIVLTDPRINLSMVKSYYKDPSVGPKFAKVKEDPPAFAPIGTRLGGSGEYGKVFEWRCNTLRDAMKAGGVEFR